jgi:hypothetical protein
MAARVRNTSGRNGRDAGDAGRDGGVGKAARVDDMVM